MKAVWLRYEHQQLSQLHDEYALFSVVARCDFSLLRVHVLEKRICIYMYIANEALTFFCPDIKALYM